MPTPQLTIGIYGQIDQETVHRNISGVLRYCDEMGGLLLRDFRMLKVVDDYHHVPPPWQGRVDGMIVSLGRIDNTSDKQLANWVLRGGVPAVSVAADWQDARVPAVYTNHTALGRLASEHLMQCGCVSYLFVGYQLSTGSAGRGNALRSALARQGRKLVEYASSSGFTGTFEDEGLARAEKKLVEHLKNMPKPLGVWALNDTFASAVCVLSKALGLAVPEQVKVLGLGNFDIARKHRPALSSIHTPSEEIGYLAMRVLHKMLNGQRGVRKVTQVAATELVARASTIGAPPPNNDVDIALEYIARHACSQLTVLQVAHTMGVSPQWLGKMFQQSVGRSPGQEIQRVRLETAKDLLEKTHISISRIGSMVGFEETAAFSKFFTKQTGLSPLAYRQKHG